MKNSAFSFLTHLSRTDFEQHALATFQKQYQHNKVYRSYCDLLTIHPSEVKNISQIPFLPIRFFKTHQVRCFTEKPTKIFTSSGTSGSSNSEHAIRNLNYYKKSFNKAFEMTYGNPKEWTILALLPSYLEREGSSLIYMMEDLISQSQFSESGFYLNEWKQLDQLINELEDKKRPTLLLGVSFALLDFIERYPQKLNYTTIMETGGMKGKRPEITREELHDLLRDGFGVASIHSEYGMTELLSQAYSNGKGRFYCPPWMKISPFEVNDPFSRVAENKIGRLNIIDLANQESCAFIATDDLGKIHTDGSFEVMGRVDDSDIRGCNLLVF